MAMLGPPVHDGLYCMAWTVLAGWRCFLVYRQLEGVAMGNHLAPPFAILFMDKLEQKMLATAEKKPEFVDDCLMAWLHGEENLKEFIKHCNNQHPHIKFT